MSPTQQPKRSLMLAGGGIKVAFQAGVLQVWLDEAGLTFDHVDGASGGVFNLAMLCQGMSGQQIADNWRTLPPALGIDFNWREYLKTFYAESILTLDNLRERTLPRWGIDWNMIRASTLDATFNVYNFTRHELEVLSPAQMSEDFLVACVSLPMWFPPVQINGQTYIDPVFVTDANVEEAINRGADEIWVIWTVSEHQDWEDGFVANYFQIVETSANGNFQRICARIERNNAAIAAGGAGEFGRPIELKILKAEVPLHYLINLSNDRLREAVNRGVDAAREWCAQRGIALRAPAEYHETDLTLLTFKETMRGSVSFAARAASSASQESAATPMELALSITIDGVQCFVGHPAHEGYIDGVLRCAAFGGERVIERGWFNLMVDDPRGGKQMRYLLHFRDDSDQPHTLIGIKQVRDDPGFDMWSDTTTLYVRVLNGHYVPSDTSWGEVLARGTLSIGSFDVIRMIGSMRVDGPRLGDKTAALRDFGAFFVGRLWDVYAKRVLPYAPF